MNGAMTPEVGDEVLTGFAGGQQSTELVGERNTARPATVEMTATGISAMENERRTSAMRCNARKREMNRSRPRSAPSNDALVRMANSAMASRNAPRRRRPTCG